MKIVTVELLDYSIAVTNMQVSNEHTVGDIVYSRTLGECRIIGLKDEPKPVASKLEKEEEVPAQDLKVGDEIYYCNEWRIVLSVYCHPKSCYQKPNLSQSDSTIPLSVRVGRNTLVRRKTENYIMSINLLSSNELVKEMQAKLIDYSALNDAPDRIEAVPSVFIDKAPVMHALKKEIQAVYAKLGENIKKI